jgi:hypothetical protein
MNIELLPGEIWKEIPGLKSYYFASNLGRVYSISRSFNFPMRNGENQIRTTPGRILNQMLTPGGYLRVQISVDGYKRKYYTHVLIADAFLEKLYGKILVNHIDGNKENNTIDNLERVTHRENSLHSHLQKTKTGIPGIYFHPTRNRYQGAILFNGKRHQIGDHKTLDEAKEAYSKKMIELGLFETRYAP